MRGRHLGDICAHGGQGEALVALGHAPTAAAALQHGLQLLLEVAVEEAVHHRVDAGGGHGRQVARREDDVVLAGGQRLVVPVEEGVEDVERQPAEGECHHDGDQHGVDALGAAGFPLARVAGLLHHVLAPAQAQEDAQVAEQDEQQGQAVLEEQQRGGVGQPVALGRPQLHADEVVAERVEGDAQVPEGRVGEDVEGEEGQRDEAGHHPGDGHRQVGVARHRHPARRVDDQLVAFQGDEHQGEDGDSDGHALDEGRDLAQGLPEYPAVHQGVDHGDGQAHHTHQDVRAGEVSDENVGDVSHLFLPGDDEDQAGVANQTNSDHRAVGHYQERGATH